MAIPAMRIITTPKLEIDEFQRCSVSLVNISRDFKDMNEASGAFNQISDCSDPLGSSCSAGGLCYVLAQGSSCTCRGASGCVGWQRFCCLALERATSHKTKTEQEEKNA